MAFRQRFVPSLSGAAGALHATPALRPSLFLQQLVRPLLFTPVAIPTAIRIDVPSIIAGVWESILRAVPKKKTSHSKKRQRFLAGKALEDVTALNKCSACGNVKRAHLLCPFCVNGRCWATLEMGFELANSDCRDSRHVERKVRLREGDGLGGGEVKGWSMTDVISGSFSA